MCDTLGGLPTPFTSQSEGENNCTAVAWWGPASGRSRGLGKVLRRRNGPTDPVGRDWSSSDVRYNPWTYFDDSQTQRFYLKSESDFD